MSKVKNFIDLVVALVQGDDAKTTALKIQRKAAGVLKAQVAVKEAETFSLEEELDSANTAMELARVNSGKIISGKGDDYIIGVLRARKVVKDAEEALADHKADIKMLKEERELVLKD